MIASDPISAFLASFTLIGLAEVGDKSQLVCMALASRHHPRPVLLGAATAFLLLNTLAVTFGAAVAQWVPERIISAVVALLFGAFGILALRSTPDHAPEEIPTQRARGVFFTTVSLIFLAEFGDKTQIAVAGLASNMATLPVWVGATTALVALSVVGVVVGRTFLQRLPTIWLHRVGGAIFLVFAGIAGWRAFG